MRAVVLLAGILGALGISLAHPYAGVLLWTWFSLQQPHQEAYGFVQSAPLNLVIAAATLATWLLSRERKLPPSGFIFWMLALLLVWMTFNSFFAFDSAWSWPYWDRTWKTFVLAFLIAATAHSRARTYALVWIVVISLLYYGVKGGLFTLLTGGHFHVLGPPASQIGDNNALATALLMVLPLANYVRGQVADKRIAQVLLGCMLLTLLAIVGTYSRGALIGMGALAVFMLPRVRNKLLYVAFAGLIVLFVFEFMPDQFLHRASTISAASDDLSFQGRLYAWRVALLYATDHFPFGAGFYGPQLPGIFNHYFPEESTHAAHSIYFQVLGEHGFIGLVIYVATLAGAFLRCSKIISAARRSAETGWAADLAMAIQASLFVFCVAGAALSIAYYDLCLIEVAMLLPLGELILKRSPNVRPKQQQHALPV